MGSLPSGKPPPARYRPGARSARRGAVDIPSQAITAKETNMWLKNLRRAARATCSRPRSSPIRLGFEPLEDRKVLAAYINEVYFDPPGSGFDYTGEYIELRGTPSMSLDDYYLIVVENENDVFDSGNPGGIEFIFDHQLTLDRSASREPIPLAEVTHRLEFGQHLTGSARRWGRALAVGADAPECRAGRFAHRLSCGFVPSC